MLRRDSRVITDIFTGGINLKTKDSWKWDIGIAGVILDADNRFVLRFVDHGTVYYPAMIDQIPSPAFTVNRRSDNDKSSSTEPSATVAYSSAEIYTSPTIRPTVSDAIMTPSPVQTPSGAVSAAAAAATTPEGDKDLSGGSIAGIAIGAVAAVVLFVGIGFFIGIRRRRKDMGRLDDEKSLPPDTAVDAHAQPVKRPMSIMASLSAFAAPSRYSSAREVAGSSKQPFELDAHRPGSEYGASNDPDSGTPTISQPSNSGPLSPTSPPRRGDSTTR